MHLKALCVPRLLRGKPTKKLLLIMKFTAIILLSACLTASANGFSQTVTLSEKNARLEKVFQEIKRQTGYVFFYNYSLLDKAKPITVKVKDVSLEEALALCFKDQPLGFVIENKTVIVTEKKPDPEAKQEINLPPPPITVKGRVLNENGEPVASASVVVKGDKTKGTTTNSEGYFTLSGVDENATIVISGVEIETIEVRVNGRAELGTIVAKISEKAGENVTIKTNYYQVEKDLSTMNITKVTSKDIERQPLTSPLLSLVGRVPGLDITPRNGAPGNSATIILRGINSLRVGAPIPPIYVIDGVPIDNTPIPSVGTANYSFGFDPLSTLNPSDIESIEILKDAAATSIYGSRGANGVILITTKQAKGSNKTSADINFYQGFGQLPRKIELLNTQQYLGMRKEAYVNDGVAFPTTPSSTNYDLTVWDKNSYTDWQDVLLGDISKITDVQASISGGTSNTSFRLNGEYYKETDIYPGDFGFSRYNGSLSINHISTNGKFRANLSAQYGANRNKTMSGSTFMSALTLPPNAPKLYNEDGSVNWAPITMGNDVVSTFVINPIPSLLYNNHTSNLSSLISNGYLSFEIKKSLFVKINLGYTTLHGNDIVVNPLSALPPEYRATSTASSKVGYNDRKSWIIEPQIAYTKDFGIHKVEVVGGTTFQGSESEWLSISGTGYTSDVAINSIIAAPTQKVNSDNNSQYRYAAIYGRVGYGYDRKYLLDLSARRDGSSRFGPGKQFGNFGAIGAGWVISKEKWIEKNIHFLSFGKIRTSYGVTGSDNIGDYNYLNLYQTVPYTYQGIVGLEPSQLFNPDLQWEKTKKFEIAAELRFFNDRVATEIVRYINRSSNQLISYALPATTGFDAISSNFDATVENTGWEFVLQSSIIQNKGFEWTISANITVPKNKLAKFDDIEQSSYANTYKVGEPLTMPLIYVWKGINPQTGLDEVEDLNHDGNFSSLDRTFGKAYGRKFYGGINNTLLWGNFEFSALVQFSDFTYNAGGIVIPTSMPGGLMNQPTYILNRWQSPGDITAIRRFSQSGNASFNRAILSDAAIGHNRFARLKTASLTYHLPERLSGKIGFQNIRIFIQGQNLLTIGDFMGFDPETGNSMPPLRMITFGVQLKL